MNDTQTNLGDQREQQGWATAKTLAEALPYIQIYDRETVVIKYGGHAMGEEEVAKLFAADAVLLKLLGVHPVIVHGGGPQISRMLERAGVKSTFVDGLRVTDAADHGGRRDGAVRRDQQGDRPTGSTAAGAEADVRGVGLSGKDARLITVEKATKHPARSRTPSIEQVVDLGFVGEPKPVDPEVILEALIYADRGLYPGVAPIGVSEPRATTYNINADTVAGALAGALKAKRMLLLTDVAGRARTRTAS